MTIDRRRLHRGSKNPPSRRRDAIAIALAVPFAVSGVRVNPAVGVSKSIGLFMLYYVLFQASTALGSRAVVDPLWAALTPNLSMLGLGIVLMLRVR